MMQLTHYDIANLLEFLSFEVRPDFDTAEEESVSEVYNLQGKFVARIVGDSEASLIWNKETERCS
jgi:hypothetical protein